MKPYSVSDMLTLWGVLLIGFSFLFSIAYGIYSTFNTSIPEGLIVFLYVMFQGTGIIIVAIGNYVERYEKRT